jgi:hypothetical protein
VELNRRLFRRLPERMVAGNLWFHGGGTERLDSGHVSEVELTGFADGLGAGT